MTYGTLHHIAATLAWLSRPCSHLHAWWQVTSVARAARDLQAQVRSESVRSTAVLPLAEHSGRLRTHRHIFAIRCGRGAFRVS